MSKPASPNRKLVLDVILANPGCHGGDVKEALKHTVSAGNVSNTLTNLARDGAIEKTGRIPNIQYWPKGSRPKASAIGAVVPASPLEEEIREKIKGGINPIASLWILITLINSARNATENYYKMTPEGSHERARMQEILQRMNMVDDLMKGAAACQLKNQK